VVVDISDLLWWMRVGQASETPVTGDQQLGNRPGRDLFSRPT
jgi:hypothetical protein